MAACPAQQYQGQRKSGPLRGSGWLDPADRPIATAVNHIVPSGASVFEHQGIGVAQVQHHHGVGYRAFRDIGWRVRKHVGGIYGRILSVCARSAEGHVAGIFLAGGLRRLLMAILQAALVAAQLLVDLFRRLIESQMGALRHG